MTKSNPHSPTSQTNNPTTRQLNREAKWSLYLTFIYLAGWVIFAYFLPNGTGLLGFPLWFEMSCIVLPILFILMSMATLKTVYKEIDLNTHTDEDNA
ncbi:YhdT family protein [Moraxella oblonga]|uniref:YhdT family protein n=1 Tax=Moraxella oblonga TaxID=200413 RepID=UPI0008307CDD|nr:YhdT family protein [Moraxella oblonga]